MFDCGKSRRSRSFFIQVSELLISLALKSCFCFCFFFHFLDYIWRKILKPQFVLLDRWLLCLITFWSSTAFKSKAIFAVLRTINSETLLKNVSPCYTGTKFETHRKELDAHKLYVIYLDVKFYASHIIYHDT